MRYALAFFLLLSTMLNAQEYKAVFNCNAKDISYIASRMVLVERTMDMIEKKGEHAIFAITIHGSCAPIVSQNYDEIYRDEESLKAAELSHKQLQKLAKRGVEITVCAMSLNANTIPHEDVLPTIKISPNSFLETISYQNNGYALMVFE